MRHVLINFRMGRVSTAALLADLLGRLLHASLTPLVARRAKRHGGDVNRMCRLVYVVLPPTEVGTDVGTGSPFASLSLDVYRRQ